MPRTLSDSFFGSIALKNKVLTRDQLTQALRVQWERTRFKGAPGDPAASEGPTLGEVCRMLGFLREDEVNAILWAQAKSEVMLEDSLTGNLCLRNRLVSRAQLDEALEDQRALDFTVRLGDILCKKGYIDRQQLHAVLKAQSRMKSGKLKPSIVPPERKAAPPSIEPAPEPKPAAAAAAAPAPKKAKPARRVAVGRPKKPRGR